MRTWYPGGDLGVIFWTLPRMVRLVREGIADPLTVFTARHIVASCPPRNRRCEAQALRAWLADRFRFVADPVGQETLTSPRLMLEQIETEGRTSGDCDEAAVLGATLAAAIGFRPYAVVAGYRGPGDDWRHVYVSLPLDPLNRDWVDLDITHPDGVPYRPPSRTMTFKLY